MAVVGTELDLRVGVEESGRGGRVHDEVSVPPAIVKLPLELLGVVLKAGDADARQGLRAVEDKINIAAGEAGIHHAAAKGRIPGGKVQEDAGLKDRGARLVVEGKGALVGFHVGKHGGESARFALENLHAPGKSGGPGQGEEDKESQGQRAAAPASLRGRNQDEGEAGQEEDGKTLVELLDSQDATRSEHGKGEAEADQNVVTALAAHSEQEGDGNEQSQDGEAGRKRARQAGDVLKEIGQTVEFEIPVERGMGQGVGVGGD